MARLVFTVWLSLVVVDPWVLVSQITRQACQPGACQPAPRSRQERAVQTFGTVEECLKVRDAMAGQALQATAPVNAVVQQRSPTWHMRLTTTFVCRQAAGTTGEQLQ